MGKYLLTYTGDATPPASEEEGQAVMSAWMAWFGTLGDAVVDGGNPTDASKTVGTDGSVSDGTTGGVTGYSVISADSLDAATELARSCPHLAAGGVVEVYETVEIM